DIITELSRFASLDVIARNSSFQYRDKTPDVRRVGRELGVRYVVEGSVRRIGGQVRITAQLIDARSGRHLWVDRYDRRIEDLFDVQDEVVRSVVAALAHGVLDSEVEVSRARGKPLVNLPPLQEGEKMSTVPPLPADAASWETTDVMFATASGYVRRNKL